MIAQTLRQLGFEVVGPVSKLADALAVAQDEALDGAILDVTIRGGKVYPVAGLLADRNVPFVLATGHGDWALPDSLRHRPRLDKPFTRKSLEQQIGVSFGQG